MNTCDMRTLVLPAGAACLFFAFGVLGESADRLAADAKSKPAASAKTGTVEGTVAYDRDRKRRWRYERFYLKGGRKRLLAEAVIALTPAAGAEAPEHRDSRPRLHVIDQQNFTFTPETIAIRIGDRVKFTNGDAVTHNVFSTAEIRRFDINLQSGDEDVQTFGKSGGIEQPIRLRCVFHSNMQAWIFVFDHPHFAVTGADGRFRLQDVPPGRYDLTVVHPAGELKSSQPIKVTAGKSTQVDVRVSPDDKVESKRK